MLPVKVMITAQVVADTITRLNQAAVMTIPMTILIPMSMERAADTIIPMITHMFMAKVADMTTAMLMTTRIMRTKRGAVVTQPLLAMQPIPMPIMAMGFWKKVAGLAVSSPS